MHRISGFPGLMPAWALAGALALLLASDSLRAQTAQEPSQGRPPSVAEKLGAQVGDLDIVDATFREAVESIRKVSGANLVVDPQLVEWMDSEQRRFTIRLKKVNLLDALDILLEFASGSVRCLREGALYITSADAEEATAVQILYDLGRITRPVRWEPAPLRDLFATYLESEVPPFFDEVTENRLCAEDVAVLIRDSIEPESWDGLRYQLQIIGNVLAVTHRADIHERIRSLLSDLEAMRGPTVMVRMRPYLLPESALARLETGSDLTEKDLSRIEASASTLPQPFGELCFPVNNGERAHIKTGRGLGFVSGRSPDERYHSAYEDGLVLDVQPLHSGADPVPLVLRLFLSRAGKTGRTCPELRFLRLETALAVPAGKPVLISAGSVPFPEGARDSMLAVVLRLEPGPWPRPPLRDSQPAADRRVWDILRKTQIDVDFMDTPLDKAMAHIAERAGLNIVIHPDVYSEFSEDELMVVLKVREIPLGQILMLICNLKNLGMEVRRGVLRIHPGPGAVSPDADVRVYPVFDLVARPWIPEWTTGPRSPLFHPWETEPPELLPDESLDGEILVHLIRECVHPDAWDTPPNQLHFSGGRIVARSRSGTLDLIGEVLGRLRRRVWAPVSMEGTFFSAGPDWLESRGLGGPTLSAEACGLLEKSLGEEGAAAAGFRGLGTAAEAVVLTGGRQVVHMRSWSSPDRYETDVLLDGWHFEGNASPSPDGGDFLLSLSAHISRYGDPRDSSRESGAAELVRFTGEIRLPRNGGCILGSSAGLKNGPGWFLYVRVR